ncbi:DUF3784 domain-containing protein [Radiobacillus deserti]|nr:DUF3784 domain-containing protein [Radiobacillus deserti]
MNPSTLIIGLLFLILAYLIGVRKNTWLLSGYKQHRVRDKKKLSRMVGGYNLIAGLFLVVTSIFFSTSFSTAAIQIAVLGHVVILVYVNVTMVDK